MIPDFLKREYKLDIPEDKKKFDELQKKYREKFNRGFSTAGFCYSWDEWSEKVEYCLEHNVLMEELTGEALT